MKKIYKNKFANPCSLHDCKVTKLEIQEDKIIFTFSKGVYDLETSCQSNKATITVTKVDFDFCDIIIMTNDNKADLINCQMFDLRQYLSQYNKIAFEIVDETYGYNKLVFRGYQYDKKKETFDEMMISVYYFGEMIYEY